MKHDPRCSGPLKRAQVLATIATHGHQIVGVLGSPESAGWAYTIGLTETRGCELLICGLDPQNAGSILNHIASKWPEQLGVPTTEYSNLPLLLMRCDAQLDKLHGEYVIQADHFYGKPVDVVQVVLSDREGRTPLHSSYDHAYMGRLQPLFVNFPRSH